MGAKTKIALSAGHYPSRIGASLKAKQVIAPGAFRYVRLFEHDEVVAIREAMIKFLCPYVDVEIIKVPAVPLQQKVAFVNDTGADMAIEIHLNSSENENAHGPLCIAQSQKGKEIARNIMRRLAEIDQIANGIRVWDCKQLGRWLFWIMKTKMPAVVVECLFLSSKRDVSWYMGDLFNIEVLANEIGRGILDYLNFSDRRR